MKKTPLFLAFFFASSVASAQMIDTIGALGIQGELSAGSYRGIGQMQDALGRINFQQDLSTLLLDVQTHFMGRYDSLSRDTFEFSGFQGINWNIGSDAPNSFYLEFNNLDIATCMNCKSREWGYRQIDINHGADCQGDDYVKMTF